MGLIVIPILDFDSLELSDTPLSKNYLEFVTNFKARFDALKIFLVFATAGYLSSF